MKRITEDQLDKLVTRINLATNSPLTPWRKGPRGTGFKAEVGCYHISAANGGYSLRRITGITGAVADVFNCGHLSKL